MLPKLNHQQRQRVRTIARDAYLYHRGDAKSANKLAAQNIKAEFVASSIIAAIMMKLLIAIAINLAAKLIAKWIEQKLSTPSMNYTPGEPGYE